LKFISLVHCHGTVLARAHTHMHTRAHSQPKPLNAGYFNKQINVVLERRKWSFSALYWSKLAQMLTC